MLILDSTYYSNLVDVGKNLSFLCYLFPYLTIALLVHLRFDVKALLTVLED